MPSQVPIRAVSGARAQPARRTRPRWGRWASHRSSTANQRPRRSSTRRAREAADAGAGRWRRARPAPTGTAGRRCRQADQSRVVERSPGAGTGQVDHDAATGDEQLGACDAAARRVASDADVAVGQEDGVPVSLSRHRVEDVAVQRRDAAGPGLVHGLGARRRRPGRSGRARPAGRSSGQGHSRRPGSRPGSGPAAGGRSGSRVAASRGPVSVARPGRPAHGGRDPPQREGEDLGEAAVGRLKWSVDRSTVVIASPSEPGPAPAGDGSASTTSSTSRNSPISRRFAPARSSACLVSSPVSSVDMGTCQVVEQVRSADAEEPPASVVRRTEHCLVGAGEHRLDLEECTGVELGGVHADLHDGAPLPRPRRGGR